PYGPLPLARVREHALAVADTLVERGVKALVIACNTASAAMLRDARERYPVPLVEVIQPASRLAVATTQSGRIGVMGNAAAVSSRKFVEVVERGITSGRQVLGLAEAYLAPIRDADVDTLVLGCTHYPLLSGVVQLAAGDHVTLVSSAEETAKDVLKVLTAQDM